MRVYYTLLRSKKSNCSTYLRLIYTYVVFVTIIVIDRFTIYYIPGHKIK